MTCRRCSTPKWRSSLLASVYAPAGFGIDVANEQRMDNFAGRYNQVSLRPDSSIAEDRWAGGGANGYGADSCTSTEHREHCRQCWAVVGPVQAHLDLALAAPVAALRSAALRSAVLRSAAACTSLSGRSMTSLRRYSRPAFPHSSEGCSSLFHAV